MQRWLNQQKIESYSGMRVGGIATLASGGLGLFGIALLSLVGRAVTDVSLTILAAVGCVVGLMLILASLILDRQGVILGDIRACQADREGALKAGDIATMRRQIGDILAFVAKADLRAPQQSARLRQPQRQQSGPRRGGRNQRRRGGPADDAAEPAGRGLWQPTDGRWMADVAEAARLGREMGGPASA